MARRMVDIAGDDDAVASVPTRDGARGGDTATRILDATLSAFAARGVEATSLDSVAAEIGIRKQTILYWFPSKDQLLFAVIDHAVAELADRLTRAVVAAGPSLEQRLAAAVDATFRLGVTDPELLALLREVTRAGHLAVAHLASALHPLLEAAAVRLAEVMAGEGPRPVAGPPPADVARVHTVLMAAGAWVVGMATEAEVRGGLGFPADLAWLRARRRGLLDALLADLT